MDLMLEMHDGNTEVYEIICQTVILAFKVRLTAKKKKSSISIRNLKNKQE